MDLFEQNLIKFSTYAAISWFAVYFSILIIVTILKRKILLNKLAIKKILEFIRIHIFVIFFLGIGIFLGQFYIGSVNSIPVALGANLYILNIAIPFFVIYGEKKYISLINEYSKFDQGDGELK